MARGGGGGGNNRPRGGKSGKSNGGGEVPREVIVSKKMSWVLRHGAVKEGLKMDEAGYVGCGELVSGGVFFLLFSLFLLFLFWCGIGRRVEEKRRERGVMYVFFLRRDVGIRWNRYYKCYRL